MLPALGPTRPVTEMSTWDVSWGIKAAGTQISQRCNPHVPIFLEQGGQIQPTGGPCKSLRTRLMAARVSTCVKKRGRTVFTGTTSLRGEKKVKLNLWLSERRISSPC